MTFLQGCERFSEPVADSCGRIKPVKFDMLSAEGRFGPEVFSFKTGENVLVEIDVEAGAGVKAIGDFRG